MFNRERSWIDNLNPRELEVELISRGLSVPGTLDEKRRRLRHYERTRTSEETPNNPDTNTPPNPNDSESTLSTVSETPLIQISIPTDSRRDAPADGATVNADPEENIPRDSQPSGTSYTGTIPRNNPHNVNTVNNHNDNPHSSANSIPTTQFRADSTSGNRLPPTRSTYGSEGLPPPRYDTLSYPEPHNPSNAASYPRTTNIPTGYRDYAPNPGNQAPRTRDPLPHHSEEYYPNYGERYHSSSRYGRDIDPRMVRSPHYPDSFEAEFNRLTIRDAEGRRSSRNNETPLDEYLYPTRNNNQEYEDRPRVRFSSNVTPERQTGRNHESRHASSPHSQDFPPRRNYPSTSAQAYDIMRKWNLKFSGARGEDPGVFLRKVRGGRSMIYPRRRSSQIVTFLSHRNSR